MKSKPRTPQWTATDLSDAELAQLADRQHRSEVRVWGWGTGSSNGRWDVAYSERKQDEFQRRTSCGLHVSAKESMNEAGTKQNTRGISDDARAVRSANAVSNAGVALSPMFGPSRFFPTNSNNERKSQ